MGQTLRVLFLVTLLVTFQAEANPFREARERREALAERIQAEDIRRAQTTTMDDQTPNLVCNENFFLAWAMPADSQEKL